MAVNISVTGFKTLRVAMEFSNGLTHDSTRVISEKTTNMVMEYTRIKIKVDT